MIRSDEVTGGNPLIIATIRSARAGAISQIKAVQYVEEAPEAVERNNGSRTSVQSGLSGLTPFYARGINGQGQIVGLLDSRMDINHCSFSDPAGNPIGPTHRKILAFNPTTGGTPASHGTHTAGTLTGDNGVNDDTRGVAYLAKIVFNLTPGSADLTLSTGTTLEARLNQHHSQGARVHSNSWGADGRTDYNGWTRAIDVFSRNNEDSMVAFAVTNTGSLTTPENAKSCLAVGAVQDVPNINSFCSGGTGPTADGRRKPEIFAPGCSILSSSANTTCSVVSLTGTSMACPAITGAAALMREYFADGFYPGGAAGGTSQNITGAMTRAMILNAGQDITGLGGGYPSNAEGWGRLVGDQSAYFAGDTRRLAVWDVRNADANALSTGAINRRKFSVNSSTEQLRVTMTFTDVPASLSAANAAVNDINLEVIAPDGVTTYRGNNFSGGVTVPGTSFTDSINSTEQVHVTNPAVGVWTVRIIGANVAQQTQGFVIVVTGDVAWTSTCPGDTNADNQVNFADLSNVLSGFGQVGLNLSADVNFDGLINFSDLSVLLSNFGASCATDGL